MVASISASRWELALGVLAAGLELGLELGDPVLALLGVGAAGGQLGSFSSSWPRSGSSSARCAWPWRRPGSSWSLDLVVALEDGLHVDRADDAGRRRAAGAAAAAAPPAVAALRTAASCWPAGPTRRRPADPGRARPSPTAAIARVEPTIDSTPFVTAARGRPGIADRVRVRRERPAPAPSVRRRRLGRPTAPVAGRPGRSTFGGHSAPNRRGQGEPERPRRLSDARCGDRAAGTGAIALRRDDGRSDGPGDRPAARRVNPGLARAGSIRRRR